MATAKSLGTYEKAKSALRRRKLSAVGLNSKALETAIILLLDRR